MGIRKFTAKELITITPEDANYLSYDELKEAVKQQNKIIKDRKRLLKKQGLVSPSIEKRVKTLNSKGLTQSVRGKDINELRQLYRQSYKTLKSDTATVSGYKKFLDNLRETAKQHGVSDTENLTYEQLQNLGKAMGELKETPEKYSAMSFSSERAFSYISKIVSNKPKDISFDELMQTIYENIDSENSIDNEYDIVDWESSTDENPFWV